MSIRTVLLLTAFCTRLLTASPSALAQAQTRTTSGTEALDAEGTVAVDNHEGQITVETWDRAEVKYEAVVRPESDADHPDATVVRVDKSSDRLALRTEYDESNEENGSDGLWGDGQNVMPVTYTLTVPQSARVEIDDHESDIQIRDLNGPVTIDTHDGTIQLTNQTGEADLESHDGPITVEEQSGVLEIDTHDSDIRLQTVSGDTEIDTHDSDVEARALQGKLTLETHGGSGSFAFAKFTDDVEIETHDGAFTITLPSDAGFDLETAFDDEDADLQADFDLAPYRRFEDDDREEANYSGSVNGGGPRIRLTTHDGSFEIRTQ